MGRNIEIVLERSRQGLLRLETIAFRQVQDWLIALLELAQSPSACGCGMYWPRNAGLFLKHTLQVPLRKLERSDTFSSDRGDSRLSSIHDKILWIVMASLLRLDIIYLFLFLRQDLLEQLFQAWRLRPPTDFSLTPGVTSDPQPDDTARKGCAVRRQLHQHAALVSGLGNRSIQPLHARRSSMRVIAPGRRKARFSAQRG